MSDNVVLIGPMGAGKSTVGKMLASRLGKVFVDTDQLIVQKSGADIPWIFEKEGEDGFRQRETLVLEGLLSASNLVIATGGGIVLRECNRIFLRQMGRVVYLTASIDQLFSRTGKDKKRPLLQVDNPKAKIAELVRLREPLYLETSHFVVDTNGRSSKWVAHKIALWLDANST